MADSPGQPLEAFGRLKRALISVVKFPSEAQGDEDLGMLIRQIEELLPEGLVNNFLARFPEPTEVLREATAGDDLDRGGYLLLAMETSRDTETFAHNFAYLLAKLPRSITEAVGRSFIEWFVKRHSLGLPSLTLDDIGSAIANQFGPEIPGYAKRDPSTQAAPPNRRTGEEGFQPTSA